MHKLTRICFNSAKWQKPTGDAHRSEGKNTFNHEYGFGHEEWLFRDEWLLDGWRYGFIQGVNKSHRKLVQSAQPFDLTLFTIQPDGHRRYVAVIREVECLTDRQANDAIAIFQKRG